MKDKIIEWMLSIIPAIILSYVCVDIIRSCFKEKDEVSDFLIKHEQEMENNKPIKYEKNI